MALTKTIEIDKIEVVGEHKHVQVRTATIVKEDGKELSRTFKRHVIHAGTIDADDKWVDTDISSEDAQVQGVANAVWTDAVKTSYKNSLIANKSGPGA